MVGILKRKKERGETMRLGPLLRNRREQSGVTLKEMSERSGLKRSIIQIIEQGDFTKLPNPKHAKMLIMTYTDALNLDGEELISRYLDEFPTKEAVRETRQRGLNEGFQYLKKSLLTLGIIILSLFVVWFILLQIGAEGNLFEKKPIYDAVLSESAVTKEKKQETEESTTIEFKELDGNTLIYTITTKDPLTLTFNSKDTLVNLTDDLNTPYVYDTVGEGTYDINEEASELFFAVEDASTMDIYINDKKLNREDRKDKKTVFYQFNIERK